MVMNNGNGNGRTPIPFRHDDVPIVGQPFKVCGGFATVSLQCACASKEPILLIGNTPARCPACQRGFLIVGFTFDGQTGQLHVNLGLIAEAPKPPAPTPAGV
jgi:hypothetical protein